MFVGHYGAAAAAAHHRIKLWHGFIAVQFLDEAENVGYMIPVSVVRRFLKDLDDGRIDVGSTSSACMLQSRGSEV